MPSCACKPCLKARASTFQNQQYVRPAPGFTIIATANTKGKGSADGRFAGTNQLNEAFLDRFHFTYEQDYASPAVEKKILAKYGESLGVTDDAFITNLVNWADIIRKSFKQQIVTEIITTRRLRDVMFAFSVFGDKMLSIERCVSRFDEDTKRSFMEFYTKIDATATAPVEVPQTPVRQQRVSILIRRRKYVDRSNCNDCWWCGCNGTDVDDIQTFRGLNNDKRNDCDRNDGSDCDGNRQRLVSYKLHCAIKFRRKRSGDDHAIIGSCFGNYTIGSPHESCISRIL